MSRRSRPAAGPAALRGRRARGLLEYRPELGV